MAEVRLILESTETPLNSDALFRLLTRALLLHAHTILHIPDGRLEEDLTSTMSAARLHMSSCLQWCASLRLGLWVTQKMGEEEEGMDELLQLPPSVRLAHALPVWELLAETRINFLNR